MANGQLTAEEVANKMIAILQLPLIERDEMQELELLMLRLQHHYETSPTKYLAVRDFRLIEANEVWIQE